MKHRPGSVDYVASNRALWDEWAQVHARSEWYNVDAIRRGECKLRAYELDEVGDVSGRTLLHLMCQIGTDSVCWARRGVRVTGVDFSPQAVLAATALANDLDVDARFVCSDVLALPDVLTESYDVVYTSRGVLGWISDLPAWANVVAHFLAPGGFVYLTDIHPVAKTLDDSASTVQVSRPYFPRAEPIEYPVKGSYADPNAEIASDVKYLWTHSVAELVTSLAQAGLVVDFLHEFPWLDRPWPFLRQESERTWVMPEDMTGELPLFLSVRAHKPPTVRA